MSFQPSTDEDFQPWIENIVFDPWLFESSDAKPTDMKGQLYYLAIKKNEILLFSTTWMNFEGMMLNEISQGKINTICSHLYVGSKKQKQKPSSEMDGFQRRGEGWVKEVKRYKPPGL